MTDEPKVHERDPHRIAAHEAGHALAAILSGVAVRDVNLIAPTPNLGVLKDPRWSGWTNLVDGEIEPAKRSIIKMAGGVAEDLIFGNVEEGSCEHDLDVIKNLLGDDPARLAQLREETTKLLRPHLDTLKLIADDLFDWRILTGESIKLLLSTGRRRPGMRPAR